MTVEAKQIREDIARAKSYIQRSDYLRTLQVLSRAVGGLVGNPVFGREKFEIQALLDECVRDFNDMKLIKKLFPAGVTYTRGKEKAFHGTLVRLYEKLKQAMDKAKLAKIRQRLEMLDTLLIEAGEQIKAKEPLEARKLFRKASEEFKDIDGIQSDIGTRMMQGGMISEAVEYLRAALDANRNDPRAHSSLITCYEVMNENDKAIEAIKDAMRYLGSSEGLQARLAKLYFAKRDWAEAHKYAQAVVEKNPLNMEAKKIVKKCEPKIFASTGAKPASGAKPGASSSKPKKSFNLDL